jgi:glyoxalase family protein
MNARIDNRGIHHVTAISGDIDVNAGFYTQVLGMRLVKRSINQDDVGAYHLFYADRTGSAGTEVTFFDWPRTPPAREGAGTIAPIALRVAGRESIAWWRGRLDEFGVGHDEPADRDGRQVLPFRDPEGQRLELVDDGGAPGGTPWERSPVPAEHQIKGVHGVTITSRRPDETARVLTELMGFRPTTGAKLSGGAGTVRAFESGEGGPGTEVRMVALAEQRFGAAGVGGVHHVAFQSPDEDHQLAWRERVVAAGLEATPVIDRYYFKSVYFREPGGALFELATISEGGFERDEPEAELGEHLSIPPHLQARRAEIEAGLKPLRPAAFTPAR